MRKTIIKISALTLFGIMSISYAANANFCRDVKLDCKRDAKSLDGVYDSLERSICRDLKLECKG